MAATLYGCDGWLDWMVVVALGGLNMFEGIVEVLDEEGLVCEGEEM